MFEQLAYKPHFRHLIYMRLAAISRARQYRIRHIFPLLRQDPSDMHLLFLRLTLF